MFFTSKKDIDAAGPDFPQAHALRRAFDSMGLNGIVCFDRTPAIYFKEVPRFSWEEVRGLRRQFWSQGLAPILALIDPTDVHILSGLAKPLSDQAGPVRPESLVTTLSRVTQATAIRELVLTVGSGDFFRGNPRSFDPKLRVDRELLRNLQSTRGDVEEAAEVKIKPQVLDALLCRLVFTCYLFDRGVINRDYLEALGIDQAEHLREILGIQPHTKAIECLYRLFKQLKEDFNGDLFNDDLDAESAQIAGEHLVPIAQFFRATDVRTGQGSLWPYDFSVIPIETISAIYEQFLKAGDPEAKKEAGAFYTPWFLVEIILDMALQGREKLLECKFLDPACGSGIFLVGLFNRLAEEWKRQHPGASYDQLVNGLLTILRKNLFGVDQSQTACRIAAFGLYLAVLDQLSPPAIQELQRKKKVLPPLVLHEGEQAEKNTRTILCADFFAKNLPTPTGFHSVVGNPPWKSEKSAKASSVRWCADRYLPMPDKQVATAFVWKAPEHLAPGGTICFVLPHGVLFNHGPMAIKFQKRWLGRHQIESVLNLSDYQRFLFEDAENPALVIRYRKEAPTEKGACVHYLTPKTDWSVAKAELISVYPQDQTWIGLSDVLQDLRADDVPLVWKERLWGTPRDWKFLDRLRSFQELGDIVGPQKDRKRWIIAQGFQEPGPSDPPEDRKELELPTRKIIEAGGAKYFRLFLLRTDCDTLPSKTVEVRTKSNTNTQVYLGPHVLLTDGFKVAYADFDVTFRQSVRGIQGEKHDSDLLKFLAAYLNSPLARYYLFHTSANSGVERAKVESGDAMRLPFPLPEQSPAADARGIVSRIGDLFQSAVQRATADPTSRSSVIRSCLNDMNELIYRYFDVDGNERILVEDTNDILIRSVRPKKVSEKVPTLQAVTPAGRDMYIGLLCSTLNGWASSGLSEIVGTTRAAGATGLGFVALHKLKKGAKPPAQVPQADNVITLLQLLQRLYRKDLGSVEIIRGIKVFDRNSIYIVKPLSQRFWTRTSALNDADEIAAAILSRPAREKV
jgi:hypothetical protein